MDFRWEERNRYNSWNQNVQSSIFPGPHHPIRHEPQGKQTRFQSTAKASFTHLMSHELSKDCPGIPFKLHQSPVNLQLPADEFINHVEDLPKNAWNFLDYPKGAADLKLSLTIGGDAKRVGGRTRNFLKKKTFSYPHNVINLDDSDDEILDHAKSRPSLPKVNHEMQDFAISEPFVPISVNKIPSLDTQESNSFQEKSECCQEQTNSSTRGVRNEVPSDDLSSKIQQLVSVEGLLDLNKVYQDDSSCSSYDLIHTYPSKKREVSERPNVNLALLDLNCEWMDEDIMTQNSGNNSTCNSGVTLASPDPTLRFSAGGHKNDMVGLKSKPASEESFEKSEEDALVSCVDQSQNSLQGGQGNRSPGSCHSGITSDVSDNQNGESDEFLVKEAAELLICISLTKLVIGQDSNDKSRSNEAEIKKREKPQYSLDSFELNTLNLTESSLDDDSVSSKLFEVNNTETKEFGTKLRRGRRMKDFQKEILPSLASLSRHEILEDINLMEGVLRSREYRKNRAKMVNCEENVSSPFRSRRSRVNYGGRRNYS